MFYSGQKMEKRRKKPEQPIDFGNEFPEWFLYLWGMLRAYISLKVSTRPDLAGQKGEARLLKRVAKLLEDDLRSHQGMALAVPDNLRKLAERIDAEQVEALNPKSNVWRNNGDVHVRSRRVAR